MLIKAQSGKHDKDEAMDNCRAGMYASFKTITFPQSQETEKKVLGNKGPGRARNLLERTTDERWSSELIQGKCYI